MSEGIILQRLISVISELGTSKKLELHSFIHLWDGVVGLLLMVFVVFLFPFLKIYLIISKSVFSS